MFNFFNKAPLQLELENYVGRGISRVFYSFTKEYQPYAERLLNACKAAQNKAELVELIRNYKNLFEHPESLVHQQPLKTIDKTDPFYALLNEHLRRLDQTNSVATVLGTFELINDELEHEAEQGAPNNNNASLS